MWNFKKTVAVACSFLIAIQGMPFLGYMGQPAKAANFPASLQDVLSRPRPIVIGNQWHINSTGDFVSGNTAEKIDFAGRYLDYVVLNRGGGDQNDLFLDRSESIKDPNKGALRTKNMIYAAAAKYGRKVYVLPYHNMTDVFSNQTIKSYPGRDFWMKPDGENIGTWDYMSKHNYWLRKSDGTITSYPGYTNSSRRFWDSRRQEVRDYWVAHAKGVVSQGFDGVFADNWLRTQIDHPDAANVKKGYNEIGRMYRESMPDKILIGNSPPDSTYTTRHVCMLEDRIAATFSGDKSVPQYFKYSDQAAQSGQACQDTYWDETSGDYKSFRIPMNLLTDNMFGISTQTRQRTKLENGLMQHIIKLGKVGHPKNSRYKADGVWQRDFTQGKVLFNDTSSTVTVTLPSGVYVDIDGNSVSKVSLGSLKGIVLKTTGQSQPEPNPEPPAAVVPVNPSELKIDSVTQGATSGKYFINLSWKDNSTNETGFEIYQSFNGGAAQLIKTPAANSTKYGIDMGTAPASGTYSFKILALNDAGKSVASNNAETSLGSAPTPPPVNTVNAPSELKIDSVSKGATSGNYYVNLSWKDNSTNETGFEILQSVNANNFQVIKTPAANATSYGVNMGNSPAYGTYVFKVVALNDTTRSAESNTAETSLGTAPVPSAPSGLSVSGVNKNSAGEYVVSLNWNDNSNNETGFEVLKSFETGSYETARSVSANSTASEINLGVNPSYGTYNFKVLAFAGTVKSDESNIASAKAGELPVPAAATELKIDNVSKGATSGNYYVNLSWKDNSANETGFEILQSFNGGAYQVIKNPAANSTKYGINMGNNPAFGAYGFKIIAVNNSGKSSDSNIAETKLGSAPVPVPSVNAPSELKVDSVSKGASSGNYYVNLSWKDNSANETGFEILQSINGGSYKLIKQPSANSTKYGINIGSSPVFGTYSYKIIAINKTDKSADSNIATTTINK